MENAQAHAPRQEFSPCIRYRKKLRKNGYGIEKLLLGPSWTLVTSQCDVCDQYSNQEQMVVSTHVFFQICSSDRIVSPRISGFCTWKKQHRSPVIWLDSCLHIFSLHRTIFQILCHLHKKPRKSERFGGFRCYQLIVTCKRMQKKSSAPTCDFELHRSGILMLQMMWEWYDCEPVALPLNMVFFKLIKQLAFFLRNLFGLPWEAPWANWQRCRWMLAATELSSLVWRARSCHFAIAGSL